MRGQRKAAIAVGTVLALSLFSTLNYVESQHIGLAWNPLSGEKGLLQAGWHATAPWVFVSEVDARPMRVCITTSAHAGVNCRLVQFIPERYDEFLKTEGFRWYWWSNRISFNGGYREEYRGFRDVMRGYAFSAQPYPFIRVLDEYQTA
jgi:hypothetical protein